jgi:hypothetical protein
MKTTMAAIILTPVLALAGCVGKPEAVSKLAPLTVAGWQSLAVDLKCTSEVLERLKQGDPKLEAAERWETFSRTTQAESSGEIILANEDRRPWRWVS